LYIWALTVRVADARVGGPGVASCPVQEITEMKLPLRRAVPVLGLAALLPAAAGAQQGGQPAGQPASQTAGQTGGATCEVDQNKPASLAKAVFAISRAGAVEQADARNKMLQEAIKSVSADGKAVQQNALGVRYTMAQALALMAQDVRLVNAATRGDIGLAGTPTESVDILATLDSNLVAVQQAKPGCAEVVAQLRQVAWVNTVNSAITALNAQKLDSAAHYANRSLVIYQKNALPYYALATVAQQKNDLKAAATYWPKMVETTEGDTTAQARELRTNALFNIAVTSSQQVESAPAAEKAARARTAAAALKRYLDFAPTAAEAPQAQGLMAQMLRLSGDSASMGGLYADQLANPSKYNDMALSQAGVVAAQANKAEDAAKLFEAALAQNPYQRDALNNLAASYYQLQQYDKMLPIVRRLVEVDPANPDNYMFAAFAYQGIGKDAKVAARKKAATDSLLAWKTKADKLPAKVTFTAVTRAADRTSVAGTVENLLSAAPKSFTLRFTFLDAQGNALGTQDATVGPVAKGKTGTFRVELAKPGVAGFKYVPVS
jgi:tetratricopeptide (TPR) repeat protein